VIKEVVMNFKIRVVKNKGSDSKKAFGLVGSEFSVIDGTITDKQGFKWTNDGKLFKSFHEVFNYFIYAEWCETEFELVEETP
jgi:hypothetical protein